MLRQILSETPLYNDVANGFFSNIEGETYNGDSTFLSTMRMLLYPRMKADDRVYIEFHNMSKAKRIIENYSVAGLLEDTFDIYYASKGRCAVISLTASDEGNTAFLQKIKTETPDGWQIIEKVEIFFKKAFSTVCMVNPTNKNFVVFVANLDIRKYHYLQQAILAFVPWYFDTEQGISEGERALFYSLREKAPEKYEACLAEYAKQFDFRGLRIKKLLTGFETKYEQAEINRVEFEISSCIDKINEYNDRIADCLKSKKEKEIRVAGLRQKVAEGCESSEIMEYFLCNKNIVLENVTESVMTFSTKGYVDYFDEDNAESAINNPDSYIYIDEYSDDIKPDDMKALMTAIFVDRTLKMKFCSSYTFDLRGNVRANAKHRYNASDFGDCTPNPHIDCYHCMGNYTSIINELLLNNDYIGAIEQCIASTVSLNFLDSTVMDAFMDRMYGKSNRNVNMRCIELPNGTVVEPKEAIEYLKSQNTQEVESDG